MQEVASEERRSQSVQILRILRILLPKNKLNPIHKERFTKLLNFVEIFQKC